MEQGVIVTKIEKFLREEFGAVPELLIEPQVITAVGGEQRMIGCSVRLDFKVLK